MAIKDLGAVTAYAYAVDGGYTGTEAEFEEAMAAVPNAAETITTIDAIATTGAAGSSASVIYDKESNLLEFTIPRGDPGEFGGKIFGAKWNRLTNQLTRTRDATGITTTTTNFAHHGSINSSYNNPFDGIYPWSDIIVCDVDLTKYRNGDRLKDCISAVYGDPDFTYECSQNLFVGRYIPEFWYRSEEDSEGNVEFMVAQVEHTGFTHFPAVIVGVGDCVDVGDSKVSAGAGVPLTNISVSTIHSRAKSSGFTLRDIKTLDGEIVLYLVEYANMNIQAAIGNGCSNCYRQDASDTISSVSVDTDSTTITVTDSALSAVVFKGSQISIGTTSGATTYKAIVKDFSVDNDVYTIILDRPLSSVTTGMYVSVHGFSACEFDIVSSSVGHRSGYIGTNGRANVYYRGGVLFANRYMYTLGIYRQGGTNHIWLCPNTLDPDDYDALNTSVHTDTGIALPDLESASWQTVGGNAQRIPGLFGFMATGVSSGSSSSPVGDQQYVPLKSASNTILLFGGNANNDWNDGVFYGNWNNDAGNSNWNYAGLPIPHAFYKFERTLN